MCLQFVPRDKNYYKWFPNMGKVSGPCSFCPFVKVLRFLLVQIILVSDYSGSVKELQQLL